MTPLIAHWPRGMSARGGWTDQAGHVMDFMPTCLELAGAEYPREWNGKPLLPVEGLSLAPFLRGPAREVPRTLYWEYSGARAVRQGGWKLVAERREPCELYNLSSDPTEAADMAGRMPARVRELEAAWDAWADRVGVLKAKSQ